MDGKSVSEIVRRVGAYLIDMALVFAVFAITQIFLLTPIRSMFDTSWMKSGLLTQAYTFLTISLPTWFYFAFSEHSAQQATVGKRLMGLRVTDTAGKHIGFGQAVLRTVVKLIPWESAHLIANLPTSMWIDPQSSKLSWNVSVSEFRYSLFIVVYILLGLYFAVMVLTRRRQSVHDLIAGTVVTRKT